MSIGAFVGVNGEAKRVKNIYVGVNGEAKKVIKAYVGDAYGQAKLFYSLAQDYITISDYYMNSSGIFISYMGNDYTKINSGPAYVGACYSSASGKTFPMIVSKDSSNVPYSTSYDSSVTSLRGSIDYQGTTWYYSGGTSATSGSATVSPSNRKFTSNHSALGDITTDFLNLIYS